MQVYFLRLGPAEYEGYFPCNYIPMVYFAFPFPVYKKRRSNSGACLHENPALPYSPVMFNPPKQVGILSWSEWASNVRRQVAGRPARAPQNADSLQSSVGLNNPESSNRAGKTQFIISYSSLSRSSNACQTASNSASSLMVSRISSPSSSTILRMTTW